MVEGKSFAILVQRIRFTYTYITHVFESKLRIPFKYTYTDYHKIS